MSGVPSSAGMPEPAAPAELLRRPGAARKTRFSCLLTLTLALTSMLTQMLASGDPVTHTDVLREPTT